MSSDLYGIHFGVWRSPVRTVEAAVELAERIASSKYVRLDGIMGYEAQIAGVGDAAPRQALKNALVRHMKRRSIIELAAKRARIMERLQEKGIAVRFVNGGGTGSIASTCVEEAVTEVT
ncbi:amino acid deaminase/aldolase, partial [Clostridium perfringens]|nr:amino acid deaminase/aldolase [Clostridium perfringens]